MLEQELEFIDLEAGTLLHIDFVSTYSALSEILRPSFFSLEKRDEWTKIIFIKTEAKFFRQFLEKYLPFMYAYKN